MIYASIPLGVGVAIWVLILDDRDGLGERLGLLVLVAALVANTFLSAWMTGADEARAASSPLPGLCDPWRQP